MAYNATYTSDDLAPVVVDNSAKVVVGIGAFATVIGLALGLTFAYALAKKVFKR